jgi:hypothetical protein
MDLQLEQSLWSEGMKNHIKDIEGLIGEEVSEALCNRFSATSEGPLPQLRRSAEKPRRRLSRIMSARGWITFFARVALISAFGCWLIQFIRGF